MQHHRHTGTKNGLDFLKGRVAEALVETMFRRAGYAVSRSGRETQLHRLYKTGPDEYLPDFMIRRAVPRPGSDRPLHTLVPIEVKYRYDVSRFLEVEAVGFFQQAKRWPGLYLVLVTDNPDADRSCFQVLDDKLDPPRTSDLHMVAALDVYRSTVLEYDTLGQKLFRLIAEHRLALDTAANL